MLASQKNHFLIITGYTDKIFKEKYLLDLTKKVRETINDITICYCTHYPNFDKKLYDIFDYVIYNKENPILNWDIIDNFTKTFGCQIDIDDNSSILFFQPYHGYAHHLSICDGIMMGIGLGFDKFSLMNYDCIDFCVDELKDHINEINQSDKNIFYPYAEGNEYGDFNTEFFTFNLKLANSILELRKYSKFSSYYSYMMYEKIISKIVYDGEHPVILKSFSSPNKALGRVSYAFDISGDEMNDSYFAPFYEKWIDDVRYCFYFIPIITNDKRYFLYVDDTKDKMNCHIKINGNKITQPSGTLFTVNVDEYHLEVFEDDSRVINLKIHDERQHAIIAMKDLSK